MQEISSKEFDKAMDMVPERINKEKEITEISYFTLSEGNKKYINLPQEIFECLGKQSKLVKKIIFKNMSEK